MTVGVGVAAAGLPLRRAGRPALVDLAIFGYYATRLIKPAGLAAIRQT